MIDFQTQVRACFGTTEETVATMDWKMDLGDCVLTDEHTEEKKTATVTRSKIELQAMYLKTETQT